MRKLRTRQHIIEDLGFNHVERQVLKAGYTVLRSTPVDYSLDGYIRTFKDNGEVDNRLIEFQLKSTDALKLSADGSIKFDLSKRDLEFWLSSPRFVLLFLYDAQVEIAYYLDLQAYFQQNRLLLRHVDKYIRVSISKEAIFTPQVIQSFRNNLIG